MDISSLLGTMMNSESVTGVSQAANVSADSAQNILSAALPSLLSGALNQSQNSETAEGFASALSQHAASDTSSISSFLSGVDLKDGGKIIAHLLGANTSGTVSSIAAQTGASEEETSSVLSAAAPLLMSLLGQTAGSEANAGTGVAGVMSGLLGNANVGSLLTGLLGGSAASAADASQETTGSAASAAGGIAGILGKLFGK